MIPPYPLLLVNAIAEKLRISDCNKKLKLLTLVPDEWTYEKTCEYDLTSIPVKERKGDFVHS